MRRNLRAIALSAVGGLLMLAPASTAFATSDVYAPIYPLTGSQATPWSLVFRDTMVARRTLVDAKDDPFVQGSIDWDTQTVEGGRYDGKTIPG